MSQQPKQTKSKSNNRNSNSKNSNDNDSNAQNKDVIGDNSSEWNLPNRPAPQQIPNTPFVLYPAKNQKNQTKPKNEINSTSNKNNNSNDSKSEEKTERNNSNGNVNSNVGRIVSVEIDSKQRDMLPQLTNDLNHVMFEIETIHNRIFHLRRTNKEIKQFYKDDVDCQLAYNENIDVINRNLKNLFVYFDLYTDLTNGQIHKYSSLYETDKKVMKKYQNIDSKSVEYMMPASKRNDESQDKNGSSNTGSNVNVKVETQEKDNAQKNETDDNDNGIVIDDDGGITL